MTNIADGVPSISSFRTITGTLEVALKSLTQKLGFESLHHRPFITDKFIKTNLRITLHELLP